MATSGSRSLTLAVRDMLRAPVIKNGLAIDPNDCDVTFDGRPNPDCGKMFFAVHHGQRTNQLLTGDESMFSVDVTISARANVSFDRIGPALVDWANGVMAWADKVWKCLFRNQWGVDPLGVMNRANEYLIPTAGGEVPPDAYQWTEALYPSRMSQGQPVRPDWFSATEEQQTQRRIGTSNTMPFCGLTVVVSFTGAKRIQRLTDLDA